MFLAGCCVKADGEQSNTNMVISNEVVEWSVDTFQRCLEGRRTRLGDGLSGSLDGYPGRIEKLGKKHILTSGDDIQKTSGFLPLILFIQTSPGFPSDDY